MNSRLFFRVFIGATALAGSAIAQVPGVAAPPSEPSAQAVQEAEQRYDRGLKLYAEGDYALAVIEFQRAYELVSDYRVLYNIGQVHIQLAHYARAQRALVQYLREAGGRIDQERRSAVEADLAMLAARTGTLRVETNVAGAEILIDDIAMGSSPLVEPLLLDAGEHRLSLRKPDYVTASVQFTLAGRDALERRLDLEKLPKTPPTQIVIEKQVPRAESDGTTWRWAAWSATGALAAGAAITGGLGIKAAHDLDDQRSRAGVTRSELDSTSRRARTLLATADVLGALAIGCGGVAVYLTLSRPAAERTQESGQSPSKAASHVHLALGPAWVGLSGAY